MINVTQEMSCTPPRPGSFLRMPMCKWTHTSTCTCCSFIWRACVVLNCLGIFGFDWPGLCLSLPWENRTREVDAPKFNQGQRVGLQIRILGIKAVPISKSSSELSLPCLSVLDNDWDLRENVMAVLWEYHRALRLLLNPATPSPMLWWISSDPLQTMSFLLLRKTSYLCTTDCAKGFQVLLPKVIFLLLTLLTQ